MEDRKDKIVRMYSEGATQRQIIEAVRCKRETLLKVLREAGVHVLNKSERNSAVKRNPFDKSEDTSQYWLGYFIADGNVSQSGNAISLVSKDLDHLQKYHNYCGNTGKIYLRPNGCGTSQFANASIKEWLIKHGIGPKKSHTVDPNIPISWPLVRGVFDGDGCITTNKYGSTTIYIITGSIKFRVKLEEFLLTEGIFYTIQQHAGCWKIVIRKKSHQHFYQKIYANASIYLDRKFNKFRPIEEKSSIVNRVNSGEALDQR